MKGFIYNMGYTGLSGTVSGIALLVVHIVAVRALGPEEYGKAALVFTATNFIPYLMLVGVNASLAKYLPEYSHDSEKKSILISTGMLTMLGSTCIVLLVLYLARNYVVTITGLTIPIFHIVILYSTCTVLKLGAETILKGLLKFKMQAMLDILYTAVVFAMFFLMYIQDPNFSYARYIKIFAAGLLVYAAIVFIQYRKNIHIRFFRIAAIKNLFVYGAYSVLGSICLFVLWGSDRFFINKYLDFNSVGIYAAYYGTSLMILGRFISIFMKVFLPTSSGTFDKKSLDRKLNTLMRISFFPLFAINSVLIVSILLLYGSAYPINFSWIALFSLNAVLYTFINAKGTLLVSEGVRGQRLYSFLSLSMAIGIFSLYIWMIPSWGITGALSAGTVISLIFLIGLNFYSDRIFSSKDASASA